MANDVLQGFPNLPAKLVDDNQFVTDAWRYFFVNLWTRSGAAQGILDLQASLDAIGGSPGDMLYRGVVSWLALSPGAQFKVLRMGAVLQSWEFLDGQSFSPQSANRVLASPNGAPGTPTFRALVATDIPLKAVTVATGLTATGTTQGTALSLSSLWNEITTTLANTGVIAANAAVGFELAIFNRGANNLNIYPPVGSQINALGANNPLVAAVNSTTLLYPTSSTQMYSK